MRRIDLPTTSTDRFLDGIQAAVDPPSWWGAVGGFYWTAWVPRLKHHSQNHHAGNDRCCAGRSMVGWLGYLHVLGRVDSLIAGDCCDRYHLSSSQWEEGDLIGGR